MGPKTSRKSLRKMEVPKDTSRDFELKDTAADIQRGRGEREYWGKDHRETTEEGAGEGGRQEGRNSTVAVAKKRPRTERSKSEIDTEGGEARRTSTECQSRSKKGHKTNIYLTDSDEKAIVD